MLKTPGLGAQLVLWKVERWKPAKSADNAHDVGFLHDQKVFAVELDFGARPLAEQDTVASLDVERNDLALAVSGMMMPPLVLASASIRRTTTRSCSGRKLVLVIV
jgi:hypothetical protein